MSWSASSYGKPSAVAKDLADKFSRITCSEPENTIKNTVAAAVALAVAAMPDNVPVKVTAYGSQSSQVDGKFINNLSVVIEPQHGFLTD